MPFQKYTRGKKVLQTKRNEYMANCLRASFISRANFSNILAILNTAKCEFKIMYVYYMSAHCSSFVMDLRDV